MESCFIMDIAIIVSPETGMLTHRKDIVNVCGKSREISQPELGVIMTTEIH